MSFNVKGGQLVAPKMTAQLMKEDASMYEECKVIFWFHMLKQGMKPVRWLKPTTKGTKVNFEIPQSQAEGDLAIKELEAYIEFVNSTHGTTLSLS